MRIVMPQSAHSGAGCRGKSGCPVIDNKIPLAEHPRMTVESMSQIVEDIQSIYTIVLALAIAEAFNQAIKENKPHEEKHAGSLLGWFDCIHHTRFISLIVFLMLAAPFFQGNQKYLYLQYIEPLHGLNPPKAVSARWLNFDCLVFSVQAGLFFVMSRSLSARRWQQFYATIILLLSIDFVWALMERGRGAAIPREWVWFDLLAVVILAAFIVADWFVIRYDREKELNRWCYLGVSAVAICGLAFGYFYQLDYLIDY
jgi:hypothetical protein